MGRLQCFEYEYYVTKHVHMSISLQGLALGPLSISTGLLSFEIHVFCEQFPPA